MYHNATALAPSADGKYLFVGLPNGLAVVDVATLSSVQHWEQDRIEITSIKSYLFGSNYNLIMTQDDMGMPPTFICVCLRVVF